MDRIELIPKDVRGGGNITQSHDSMVTDEQVSIYKSTLTRYNGDSDSSYLPYYRVIRNAGLNLLWNPPRVTSDNVVHVSVNFVYASNNLPVMYSEVILDLRDSDNEVLWTASGTIMDGALSFGIEIMEDFPSVCFWNVNVSHSTYGHVHDSRRMFIGSVTSFESYPSKSILQSGEVSYLIGTVTGESIDGTVFGVPGQTVNFYEQWTPGLRVSATPSIIQSGEESSVKAQLIDTSDGSLVRESGVPIKIYQQAPSEIIEEWPANGYQTPYNDTPLEIYGQMKANGNWGGLRIYGDDNDHHYCYIGQGNATNDENAKIFYKITNSSDWTDFNVEIWRGKVTLSINYHKVEEVSCDISKPVSVWGGSQANPVSIENLVIRDITVE